jgi:hypothetical protein
MRTIYVPWLLPMLLVASNALAQPHPELVEINEKRVHLTQSSMQGLGYWAISNIGTGLWFRTRTTGAARHFHTMNAGWNFVNLGLATAGYITASRENYRRYTLGETERRLQNTQKLLLFNAGLDVGYMAFGLYLRERAPGHEHPDRLEGWGNSLLLQGGFLLAFDLTLYYLHSRQNKPLQKVMNKATLTYLGNGMVLSF